MGGRIPSSNETRIDFKEHRHARKRHKLGTRGISRCAAEEEEGEQAQGQDRLYNLVSMEISYCFPLRASPLPPPLLGFSSTNGVWHEASPFHMGPLSFSPHFFFPPGSWLR